MHLHDTYRKQYVRLTHIQVRHITGSSQCTYTELTIDKHQRDFTSQASSQTHTASLVHSSPSEHSYRADHCFDPACNDFLRHFPPLSLFPYQTINSLYINLYPFFHFFFKRFTIFPPFCSQSSSSSRYASFPHSC